jgi:tetratricopeptide (TPR) repeat protein
MKYYYRNQLDLIKFPYTRYYDRGSKDWDYAIFYCNYIDPYQLRRNIWPPKNTIHEIKVDDVTVCAIVKRENRDDYIGIQKLNASLASQNIQEVYNALEMLEGAVKYDPNNEIALLTLGRGYVAIQDYDNARKAMNRLLEIYPDYDKALNIVAFSYISEGEARSNPVLIDRAINILNKVITINYKFVDGYYNLGLAYFLKGDDNQALNYLNMAVEINGRHKRSYYLIANILEKNGDHQRAKEVLQYVESL